MSGSGVLRLRLGPAAADNSPGTVAYSHSSPPNDVDRETNARRQGGPMRKGLVGSLLLLLTSAGWTLAQAPPPGNPAVNLTPVVTLGPGDAAFTDPNSHGGDGGGACAWGSVDYLLLWV